MTTKIAVMYAGKIVEEGPTEILYKNPQHPYTRAMLASIPRLKPLKKKTYHRTQTFGNETKLNIDSTIVNGCAYASRCPEAEEKCKIIKPNLHNVKSDLYVAPNNDTSRYHHKVACHKS